MSTFPDGIGDDRWFTWASHPASGTAYQEVQIGYYTWARVTENGREVGSPSLDTESVYRQYSGRVRRAIEEMELADRKDSRS